MRMKNMKQVKEQVRDINMKRLFRRNQIIITTLAVMIAAAGYLNYAGKGDLDGGNRVYEAGVMDLSEEDILAENQAVSRNPGDSLLEIPSLDQDLAEVEEAVPESAAQAGNQLASENGAGTGDQLALENGAGTGNQLALENGAGTGDQLALENGAGAGDQLALEDPGTADPLENGAVGDQLAQAEAGSGDLQTGLENPGEAVLTSGMNVADYIANVQLSREQIRAKNKETLMSLINSPSIDEAAKQQAIQDMIDLTEISEKENAAETLLMAKGFADPVVSITKDKVDVVVNASSITDPQRAQIEDIVKRKAEVGADQIIITLLNMAE